eukprot:gene8588-9506_t
MNNTSERANGKRWVLLDRTKTDQEVSKESRFICECDFHPELFVFLAYNWQLDTLSQLTMAPRQLCVLGIDLIFNIFKQNLSLTITAYTKLCLKKCNKGKLPVLLPLMVHQSKTWQTYSTFSYTMTLANPAFEGALACDTDGERAIIGGFKHIFGKQVGDVKYAGFVDCNNESDFQMKADEMEGYMLQHKKTKATLEDPPSEFTTKNNDVANLIVQKYLSFQMKELEKLIEEIKELVEQQFHDEDDAIFERGPYKKSMKFSIKAEMLGISTVAMPILATTFNKAKELVHADSPIVIPQPAFDYGEYVGSYGNRLYPVTLGRQQECFHHSSSVCEHLLSLAQKKGNLQAFITFFYETKQHLASVHHFQQQQQQPCAMSIQLHRIQQQQPQVAHSKFNMKLTAGATISCRYGCDICLWKRRCKDCMLQQNLPYSLLLENVLFVPKLRKDLLSVATVAKKGAEMNLSKETCAVVKDKHNLVIPYIVDDE